MKFYVLGPGMADVGHGIISALLISYIFGIDPTVWIFVIGILSAFAPDLDGISELLKYGKIAASKDQKNDHRDGLHYPLLWLLLFFILYKIDPYIVSVIGFSVLLYFINDSWGTGWGVKWLWPFNNKSYKFFSGNDKSADTTFQKIVTSWTPEEKALIIEKAGDPDWLKKCYARLNPISIIEYGTLIVAIILLFLFN
jgi:hypothetical protein